MPTSDVDLVVLNTKVDVQSGLKALARLLQTRNVATKMQARMQETDGKRIEEVVVKEAKGHTHMPVPWVAQAQHVDRCG